MPQDTPLRIALLAYRGKPHVGGQGVYVRHLAKALVDLGHHVEVLGGQPYPVLDERVPLVQLPSLDIYNEHFPMRMPGLWELKHWSDWLEVLTFATGSFPEPFAFSMRAWDHLRRRKGDFDIVHDNQCLGYGLLLIEQQLGLPVLGTIHHPITVDRRIELESATGWQRWSKRRWYSFVTMQGRVARRLRSILVPSQSSADDVAREFRVRPSVINVVPLGVDTRVFHPRPDITRVPGRIVCVASADSPLKGVAVLLRAVAKLATERDIELTVVSKPQPGGPTEQLVDELSLHDRVTFVSGIDETELACLLSSAQIAVIPSLYEGFSLPAVEAMATATPLVASRAGALPEVVGDDGAGRLVPPGDAEALAAAIAELLDNDAARARMSEAAWRRVQEKFTWRTVAENTARHYAAALDAAQRGRADRSAAAS